MAFTTSPMFYLSFFTLVCAALIIQGVAGSRAQNVLPYHYHTYHISPSERNLHLQGGGKGWKNRKYSRRLMIGSVAPTCTYNECRGCKYKCRAEQVPVEGNDPIHSPYHYKCVCHR